jgi:hypothetical protein
VKPQRAIAIALSETQEGKKVPKRKNRSKAQTS